MKELVFYIEIYSKDYDMLCVKQIRFCCPLMSIWAIEGIGGVQFIGCRTGTDINPGLAITHSEENDKYPRLFRIRNCFHCGAPITVRDYETGNLIEDRTKIGREFKREVITIHEVLLAQDVD